VSEERDLLRRSVAGLLDKHAQPAAVRRAMTSDLGYDGSLWAMLCDIGAAALLVPEQFGGAGGELADAAVVMEELGRTLAPTPLLGTMLAELALLAAGEPDGELLAGLAAGETIGAVALDRDYVVNGGIADVVLAVDDGRVLHWADPARDPVQTLDPTRRLTRITGGATEVIGRDPGIADAAAILLAAEQIGGAERCLELTVAYTKQREQFGRPIGSFQALKHRMADLYVAVQSAKAVVGDAVGNPTPVSAALARLAASETFCLVAGEAIQLHGGIAITWEHDIQLYFKRAHGSATLLGPPRDQLHRLESEVF